MARAPLCPQCQLPLTFDLRATRFVCAQCGFTPSTGLDERIAEVKAQGPRHTPRITDRRGRENLSPRVLSLFESAHDALFNQDEAAARNYLQAAVDLDSEFVDAYLWLAKITPDAAEKRDYLSAVLAYAPGHEEANTLLLVLNGRLTQEQVSQAQANSAGVEMRQEVTEVKAQIQQERCPQCGGDLQLNEQNGHVYCNSCGYTAGNGSIAGHSDLLLAGLLERRANPVRWVVGERLLHCQNCGAERTLAADKLSTRCPFCATNQVIVQDALNTFEQPDGLLPFSVTRAAAGQHIKTALKSVAERISGWFDNNQVARAALQGFYLPFWVFDARLDVRRTRTESGRNRDRYQVRLDSLIREEQISDALYDVVIAGMQSPPETLVRKLGAYDFSAVEQYNPSRLVEYPAELYTVELANAALSARSQMSALMRQKYGRRADESNDITVTVYTEVQTMSYRLILCPVWVANLVEKDADHRTALVNGQTGTVVLGKAQKPRST